MRALLHLLLFFMLVVVLSVAPCFAQGHHWEEKKEGNTVYCQVFDIETRDGFLGFGKS